MSQDSRAIMAVSNNADLYESVFSSWSRPYTRFPFAVVGHAEPPPYYSNATVLQPGYQDEIIAVLRRISLALAGSLCVKDSFSELNLAAYGFRTLFDGSWLWRAHGTKTAPPPPGWAKVETDAELEDWEKAWKRAGSPAQPRLFRSLQRLQGLAFFRKIVGGSVVAGCIANRSPECVGISNVFSLCRSQPSFEEAAAAITAFGAGLPLVGYVAQPDVSAALGAGFDVTGSLRVLLANQPRL